MTPPRLQLRFPNRRALLASARAEGSDLSLFALGANDIPTGSDVTVEITVANTALFFELQGRVRMQVAAPFGRPGVGIAFGGPHKRAAAQMLAICAGRAADDGTALDSRHDVDVRCVVNVQGARVPGALRDVSNTGAFIGTRGHSVPQNDTELTIQLEPLFGRWGGRTLKARVVWVGQKKGVAGFGVRFLETSALVRDSVRRYFRAPVSRAPAL